MFHDITQYIDPIKYLDKSSNKLLINRGWIKSQPNIYSAITVLENDNTAFLVLIKTDEKAFKRPDNEIIENALNDRNNIMGVITPKFRNQPLPHHLKVEHLAYYSCVIQKEIIFDLYDVYDSRHDNVYYILGKKFSLTDDYLIIDRTNGLSCKALKNFDGDSFDSLILGSPIYDKNYRIYGIFIGGYRNSEINEYSIGFLETRRFINQADLYKYHDLEFFIKLDTQTV